MSDNYGHIEIYEDR